MHSCVLLLNNIQLLLLFLLLDAQNLKEILGAAAWRHILGYFSELTLQNVAALQLLHVRSLAQPPAEKHQNHVLNHVDSQPPPCLASKPVVISSLRAFSWGTPYVSISHPDRGCGASAEALPTSGTAEEARLSTELMRGPQMLHVRHLEPRTLLLYYPTLATAQALFNWVVMGCWGETPLVSLVTACIIRRGRS